MTARASRAYALIIASLPGHRQGQRTWGIIHCVSGAVGPEWIRRPVDEGTGHKILLSKHSDLHFGSLLPSPSFCPLSPQAHSPTSFTPGCQEVWGGEGGRLFFFFPPRLSVGSPLKTQQHLAIIILSLLLLPEVSLAGNFCPTFFSSKVTLFLGSDGNEEASSRRRGRKETNRGKKMAKELRSTRFLLNDSLPPCSCLNEIRKCVSSEVNLPLTAPRTTHSIYISMKRKRRGRKWQVWPFWSFRMMENKTATLPCLDW